MNKLLLLSLLPLILLPNLKINTVKTDVLKENRKNIINSTSYDELMENDLMIRKYS